MKPNSVLFILLIAVILYLVFRKKCKKIVKIEYIDRKNSNSVLISFDDKSTEMRAIQDSKPCKTALAPNYYCVRGQKLKCGEMCQMEYNNDQIPICPDGVLTHFTHKEATRGTNFLIQNWYQCKRA
jgi:hypothetical protein